MAKRKQAGPQTRRLTVPWGELPESGYQLQQVECGRLPVNAQLSGSHATTFVKIRESLKTAKATLNDGRPVWTNVETLSWLLQQF